MSFSPISEAFRVNHLKNIRLVAADMDGTLTQQGKFTSVLLQALEVLAEANMPVLIVTGRSAGWVEAVKAYLPVTGAIAENGGIFYSQRQEAPEFLTSIPDLTRHRQHLAETFHFLQSKFPLIRESVDNCFRLTDWTFDVRELTLTELQQLGDLCQDRGLGFTYSTVQCHIKPIGQDKATSLLQVLQEHFSEFTSEEIITVGDSPNDESLFDASNFPFSVGVANVLHYRQQLKHQPAYVTVAAEAQGFCELAELLIKRKVL